MSVYFGNPLQDMLRMGLVILMPFDKHYPNRKDWRKPYYDCQAFDSSCRPHGSDPWDYSDRMHRNHVLELNAKEQINIASHGSLCECDDCCPHWDFWNAPFWEEGW